ncbi:MAG: amidohydrolase [Candidatus Bipolaricaulota bacterium]
MAVTLKDVLLPDRIDPVSVRVQDGRIERIGEPTGWPADAQVLDGRGKLALPGFVNAHTHLAMVLLRGTADDAPLGAWLEHHIWPQEKALTEEDVYWGASLALLESIKAGVVAVADMYFHMDGVARAVEESGLRALLSYGIVAPSMAKGGAAELAEADRFAARWHGAAGGRIRVAVSPHTATTCGEDVWREAIALARDRGLRLHTHLSETAGEVSHCLAERGRRPPAYLESLGAFDVPTLAAHCVHVDHEEQRLLARRDVAVAHCPKSNAKLASGLAPVRGLLDAGARVAIGTDGAASNNRLDVLDELQFACLAARIHEGDVRGLTAAEALRLGTEDGRHALGLPVSRLQAGDVADIVLLDLKTPHGIPFNEAPSWLAFSASAADVTDVIVDGTILMRDRRVLAVDEERVQSEVGRLLARRRN